MDNVDWKDVNADQLVEISQIGNIQLKGKVTVTDVTLEQLNTLIGVFGESAFDKNAELFINAPDAIFVTGRTEILEGESEDYACIVFGADVESLTWSIYSGGSSSYTTIDATTGLLTTKEGSGIRTLTIRVIARTDAGTKTKDITVKVAARTYPASDTTTLSGSPRLNETREIYKLEVATPNVNGEYIVIWSLTGMDGYAEIESSSNTQCVIKKLQEAATVINGTLTAAVKKKYNNGSLFSKTFAIELVNDTIAETDIGVVTALYNAGLCANSAYITKVEAALITDIDLQPGTSYSTSIFYPQRTKIKSFDGFQYFTGLTTIGVGLFYECNILRSIIIPEGVTSIGARAFTGTTVERTIYFPYTLTDLPYNWHEGSGAKLTHIVVSEENPIFKVEDDVLYTKDGTLVGYYGSKTEYIAPSWVNRVKQWAFYSRYYVTSLRFDSPDVVFEVGAFALWNSSSDETQMLSLWINSGISYLAFRESDFSGASTRTYLKHVHLGSDIPSSMLTDFFGQMSGYHIKEMSVEENNVVFQENDIIYSKDGTTMLYCNTKISGDPIIRSGVSIVGRFCFSSCPNITKIKLPEGTLRVEAYAFSNLHSLRELDFPTTLTYIGLSAIGPGNSSVFSTIKFRSITPPDFGSALTSTQTSEGVMIVPHVSVSAYKSSAWGTNSNAKKFTIISDYEPQECLSLAITANDVGGRATSTKVQYTALTNGISLFTGDSVEGVEITGEAVSSEFPQNTSYTDTVEREVSFTYLGVTATTTITQGVWVDAGYSVDLNSQWQESTTITNPDSATYDGVYESFSNKGVDNTAAIMYIDINGYKTFKFYVRSYAEGSYDYVVVSNLDATLTNTTTTGANVKMTTSSKQTNGTAISNYQLVEFTGIDDKEHRISVMYRKDGSTSSNDDRGYVLIPKEQNW